MLYNIYSDSIQRITMAKKDTQKPEKTKPQKEKKAKAPKENKAGKKGKKGKKGDEAAAATSPENMTNSQLEQAIKDSNDPTSSLKKLKSPISVKNFFLFLLGFILLTFAIVIVWCAIAVDKFDFVTVIKDMSYQYGITQFFQNMWATMSGWFS